MICVKGGCSEEMASVTTGTHKLVKGSFGRGLTSHDGFDLIGAFEGSPFDGKAVSGAGKMPVGAAAVGVLVAKIVSLRHIFGASPGHGGEDGMVDEHAALLPGVSPHECGHCAFFGRAAIARDRTWSDHDIVGSAARDQGEAGDGIDNEERRFDDCDVDSSRRGRKAKVLIFFAKKNSRPLPRANLS